MPGTLPDELLRITETLSRRVHEAWCEERRAAGWKHGPGRNDLTKEHPSLVPYDVLPEDEKQYDRRTATETLRAVIGLGFIITPASAAPVLLDGREGAPYLTASESLAIALRALESGEPLVAYDILSEALLRWPEDVELRRSMALALARSGAVGRAGDLLRQLHAEGEQNDETLGLLARTEKDLALRMDDPAARRAGLAEACRLYREAFLRSRSYWTGINAATLAFVLGDRELASSLASDVHAQCLDVVRDASETDLYWATATLGEAALVLGQRDEAKRHYDRAVELAGGKLGKLHSTRQNARLLLASAGGDETVIARLNAVPCTIVLDGTTDPRPASESDEEAMTREEIERVVGSRETGFGFVALRGAKGMILLETLQRRGAETHVVLPCAAPAFLAEAGSVSPGWRERCAVVLERATEVTIASESRLEGGNASDVYADLYALGLARVRAAQIGSSVIEVSASSSVACSTASSRVGIFHDAGIRAFLFADTKGYTKLDERQIRAYFTTYLAAVADVADAQVPAPTVRNTWGDALYFVFDGVRAAGTFALALCDRLAREDWTSHGLPADLSQRIALHAGPCLSGIDPVTKLSAATGAHVSRAARIEPITPPGRVYASQAFAVLAAGEGIREFDCEYVGRVPLAKGAGVFPMFVVRKS